MAYRNTVNEGSKGNDVCADIANNRTLIVEQLTEEPTLQPEIVREIQTLQQLFNYYKPESSVALEDVNGNARQERFQFKCLDDFLPEAIATNSGLIRQAALRKAFQMKVIKQLKSDPDFFRAMQRPETRKAMLAVVNNLIGELKSSN